MSETNAVAALAAKLVEVRKRVGYVKKDGRNEGQGYSFVSAARIFDKTREVMDELGILALPAYRIEHNEITPKGAQRVIVSCTVTFIDIATGAQLHVLALAGGADHGDKASMKGETGAYKYAIMGALMISTGDDPEAAKPIADEKGGSDEAAPAAAPKATTKAKKPTKAEGIVDVLKAEIATMTQEALQAFKLRVTEARKGGDLKILTTDQFEQVRAALEAKFPGQVKGAAKAPEGAQ